MAHSRLGIAGFLLFLFLFQIHPKDYLVLRALSRYHKPNLSDAFSTNLEFKILTATTILSNDCETDLCETGFGLWKSAEKSSSLIQAWQTSWWLQAFCPLQWRSFSLGQLHYVVSPWHRNNRDSPWRCRGIDDFCGHWKSLSSGNRRHSTSSSSTVSYSVNQNSMRLMKNRNTILQMSRGPLISWNWLIKGVLSVGLGTAATPPRGMRREVNPH